VIERVRAVLNTSPLTPGDLPPAMLDTYVSHTGPSGTRYALEVYPKLPESEGVTSPLDPRFLDTFMRDVQSVDPHITGVLPQIYYSNEVIRASFVRSGAIAIVVVLVIVLVVFHSLVAAVMCMMPVIIAFVLTFGVMDVFGMSVNPANIIVLPLLFGIGVDCGVHVMHRYRLNPHERPLGLTHGTGKGVTLTSLTTMAGFASMLVARHRGIQGLGLVMTIGIGLTLATCWTVLPAVLELRARSRTKREARRESKREAA
jgi:predicted RND superfamily exporter protein